MELLQESMNIQANLQSTNAFQWPVRLNLDCCVEKAIQYKKVKLKGM
jgi:hypothetical protein